MFRASDLFEDAGRGGGPDKGLGIGVVPVEVVHDSGLQVGNCCATIRNVVRGKRKRFVSLVVAPRQSRRGLEGRARRRPPGSSFAFERGAPAIALHVHLEDRRVVNEPVDRGQRHGLIGKDLRFAPVTEL